MTTPTLVSFDIGGTLAQVSGPTLAAVLAERSPVESGTAYRIIREILHVAPKITVETVGTLCRALLIPVDDFPDPAPAPAVIPHPDAATVLAEVGRVLPVVTLSNVTCLDADDLGLPAMLGTTIRAYYRSCRLGYVKPDPRAFHAVAAAEGAAVDGLVHIGDHWECDVLGALAAGATAVWLSRGRTPPTSNPGSIGGVHVVGGLADVPAVIRALTERQA